VRRGLLLAGVLAGVLAAAEVARRPPQHCARCHAWTFGGSGTIRHELAHTSEELRAQREAGELMAEIRAELERQYGARAYLRHATAVLRRRDAQGG